MIPSCSHTGTPSIPFEGFRHFTSSTMSGSASLIRARTRASVSPRQSVSFLIRASMRSDGESSPFAAFDALFDLVNGRFMPEFVALDHLPAIPRRIAETGVHRAVTLHRLLRKLHAAGAHAIVGGAA